MSESQAIEAHNVDGATEPIRPGKGHGGDQPTWCLRGHCLQVAGQTRGFRHSVGLPTVTCGVCYELGQSPHTWCLLDPQRQYAEESAPGMGLVLVATPPAVRGGIGRIELRRHGQAVGDVDLAICGPCQCAVLEHVRVDEPHRRQGYGWTLVAAALARAPVPHYRWSTTRIDTDDFHARAFWARVPFPGALGEPDRCSDMHSAAAAAS